uniref:Protein-lysine N-methyltransferase SMYD4 n=2 Tax=Dendroctonus ponderosae TaxID=77166 RepID=A0AAR5PKL8_DENPD
MKSDISQFQRYCEKAIGQLTAESLEAFKETKDDVARIQVMYPLAQQIPLDPGGCSKNFQEAEQLKSAGNRAFALKDYSEAIQSYNQAIICCPQQTIEDRQLLTILVSNRSACNFELGNIRKVLDDLDYIGEIGDYPSHLCYKLWLRKGKCYSALQNKKLAGEAFNEALKCLEQSGLTEEALQTKAHEIQRAQTGQAKLQAPKSQLELIAAFPEERFVGGEEFPAAHPKITVSQDSIQGRYAKAVGDIETGTILVEETAFGAVVDKEHALKNCQNCLASVELPIACPQCSEVIFCSTHCSRMAFKSFHGVECGMQRQLFQCGASVNCLLALRLISQKPLRFFLDKRSKLQDFMRDSCKKSAPYKKVYRSNDYDNVFFLCRNESLRKKEELVAYACMSIYLLRLLKQGFYFGESTAEAPTTNELFVGGLLLRHLQILQFNAHEISQLQNRSSGFEAACIGAGLYPTLALFNHSCDPSLVRYNVRNKIIARAIRPIKAEDIIYENYGPLYSAADLQQRLEELKKNYWFECMCQPCTQLWPTVRDMRENELRIPCRNDQCPYVFLVKGDDDPFLTCPYCENVTGLLPNLRGLMKLEEILPEAEHKLGAAHFEVALRKFAEALDVLFQFSSPPHPEIIKVQQRMRDCMVHFGNKAFDYKPHIMQ